MYSTNTHLPIPYPHTLPVAYTYVYTYSYTYAHTPQDEECSTQIPFSIDNLTVPRRPSLVPPSPVSGATSSRRSHRVRMRKNVLVYACARWIAHLYLYYLL